jgi:hypothetical protein
MDTRFWPENLKGTYHYGDTRFHSKIKLKPDFKETMQG